MPRKSAASLATPTPPRARPAPEPPADLPAAAAVVWRRTLAALPADWIGIEALPVLERFCRHTARVGELEALISAAEAGSPLWRVLVTSAGQESRLVVNCARSLRLTPQTRLRAETAATRGAAHSSRLAPAAGHDDDELIPRVTRPWEWQA